MSATWIALVGLAAGTALIRAAGPVLLGGRRLPPLLMRLISLLAPAVLAALVVVESFTGAGGELELDARAAGLTAAAAVLWTRRDAILPAVAAGALCAAALRALG